MELESPIRDITGREPVCKLTGDAIVKLEKVSVLPVDRIQTRVDSV